MPITEYKCICCEKLIKKAYEDIPDSKPWTSCYLEGAVDKITVGYGSVFDADSYIIAICDSCIADKKEKGVLVYIDNYLFPDEAGIPNITE